MFLLDLFIQYEWFWLCGHLLTLWCCSFSYTIKKSIFRTAIWDSNRPQPLPSITLKHFIHVSYELLQLAAIMTFVQLQQAALCLCSRNPRRCQLCGWGDGSLFVLLLPSVMCGTRTLPSHRRDTITSLSGQAETRFLVSVSPFLSLIGIIELSSNLLYLLSAG